MTAGREGRRTASSRRSAQVGAWCPGTLASASPSPKVGAAGEVVHGQARGVRQQHRLRQLRPDKRGGRGWIRDERLQDGTDRRTEEDARPPATPRIPSPHSATHVRPGAIALVPHVHRHVPPRRLQLAATLALHQQRRHLVVGVGACARCIMRGAELALSAPAELALTLSPRLPRLSPPWPAPAQARWQPPHRPPLSAHRAPPP